LLVNSQNKFAGQTPGEYGTFLAEFQVGASLSPSHAQDSCVRRHRLEMKKLVRKLMVVAILGMVSAGAFGQKRDQDKRPPKEPVKVITNDRKDNKPPQQNNQPKHDDKKKPN